MAGGKVGRKRESLSTAQSQHQSFLSWTNSNYFFLELGHLLLLQDQLKLKFDKTETTTRTT